MQKVSGKGNAGNSSTDPGIQRQDLRIKPEKPPLSAGTW
jgi:hypothetical protein